MPLLEILKALRFNNKNIYNFINVFKSVATRAKLLNE